MIYCKFRFYCQFTASYCKNKNVFAGDGEQGYDIKARLARAKTRCGQLHNIFDSAHLSLKLKIRLYVTAVCSLITYGCETWDLTEKVMRQINGANSIMLVRITVKHFREEANALTTSFDLVLSIRRRRMKWVDKS